MLSRDQKRLHSSFWRLSFDVRARIVTAAERAAARDPRIDPSYADCLMTSAGAAAHFRHVETVQDGLVYYRASSSFGDRHGRPGRCSLERWRKWAMRATIHHWASVEIFVPGAGWELHDDVLNAVLTKENSMESTPNWEVEYRDADGGSVVRIKVTADDRQEAISNASGKLNCADIKPARPLYFQAAKQL